MATKTLSIGELLELSYKKNEKKITSHVSGLEYPIDKIELLEQKSLIKVTILLDTDTNGEIAFPIGKISRKEKNLNGFFQITEQNLLYSNRIDSFSLNMMSHKWIITLNEKKKQLSISILNE